MRDVMISNKTIFVHLSLGLNVLGTAAWTRKRQNITWQSILKNVTISDSVKNVNPDYTVQDYHGYQLYKGTDKKVLRFFNSIQLRIYKNYNNNVNNVAKIIWAEQNWY